jgi:histone chaperone ASF1
LNTAVSSLLWRYNVQQTEPPNPSKIPKEDIIGITAVLITCSYGKTEFVRIGYYVNNAYEDPELELNPPADIKIEKLVRRILADKPRITKFPINWELPQNNATLTGDKYLEDRKEIFNAKAEMGKLM